jgi:hypothetical protein
MKYDIIGDIHGYADQLIQLLEDMGYRKRNGVYRHHEHDRQAIFVGDFIDRGPKIRETLEIVKAMVDNKTAHVVLGNHEYNALCYHTHSKTNPGGYLRPQNDKNTKQHLETLKDFCLSRDDFRDYLYWFITLPLCLEIEGMRVVHASWIDREIEKLKKWTDGTFLLNESLLHKSAEKGTEEYDAIETTLKGVEIPLPEGETFEDKDRNKRDQIRIRWWEQAADKTYREMVFPSKSLDCGKKRIDTEEATKLEAYNDPVPVFFGHYWLTGVQPEIQTKNICCLDYSIADKRIEAKKRLLVAYCWHGEKKLKKDHFKCVKIK